MSEEYKVRKLKMNCQDTGCPRMALYEVVRSDGWRIWVCQKHLDELLLKGENGWRAEK